MTMTRNPHVTHGVRQGAAERRYRRAAIIAVLALALITGVVFYGPDPFAQHYQLRGVFASANDLAPGSEVRIAGVHVGDVSAIGPGPRHTSIVTMNIDNAGRPVHTGATLSIEPRLILEGNFYVRLSPGTGGAPELRSGATIPEADTSVPVQLDQVLDVFDLPTRDSLQRSIGALASGLGSGSQRRAGTSPTGYSGVRDAVREFDGALTSITQVAHAAQGTQPGDLGRAVQSSADFTAQLAQNPAALADLVTNFNRFTGSLAAEDDALGASVRGLDAVLRTAPPSLTSLDRTLPTLTYFGHALQPTLRAAPGPLRAGTRLLTQVGGLIRPPELPALLTRLQPVTAGLPGLEQQLRGLLPLVTSASQCLSTHVARTLDQKLPDGANSTGDPAWLDLMHSFAGAEGAAPGFDGNGVALRVGVTEGPGTINGVIPGLGYVVGGGPRIEGVQPTWLGYGVEPPYRPDQSCTKQPLPVLSARSGPPPTLPVNGDTVQMGGAP